uniref:Uncharacterized protein n=1 Tax=Brassica oleracea TaxID=3712 RepID=A0A3P6F9Z9_BRAOL|nr:unnamed protein product [Brassica oleracea]
MARMGGRLMARLSGCFSVIIGMETIAKKKVEDVMPIATGHEKEELEAELENKEQLELVREEIRVWSLFNHTNLLPLLDHAIISVKVRKVILESAILTTVVVLSLTVYTFWAAKRGYDFNFLEPFLFGALIVLIVFAMIQVMPLIPNSMP